jgi:predicted ATPase
MANNRFFESIQLNGFLSFPPGSPPFEMKPLNVLIGPNGAGKSNLLEVFELLHAAPTNFASAIRDGGGPAEWIWKGTGHDKIAQINAVIGPAPTNRPLRYKLAFTESGQRVEVIDEAIEDPRPDRPNLPDVRFYYRFQQGHPVINVRGNGKNGQYKERRLERDSLPPDQSVLSQRKDPDLYPELTWAGRAFGEIRTFREWSFGRYGELRKPQQADDPADQLRSDARNLALVLNEIEHRRGKEVDALIQRFLPRFQRLSTRILGGTVQFYLHEQGLDEPIPATRLSDGTIRFLAILAALLAPTPPRMLCIEEPEMGLHPDALALLAEMLVEASSRMQLVITTHSDILISALTDHVDSVVVCENVGHGTILNRLEVDKLSFWLDKYRLGEIWRIGEIGGNL